MIKALGLALLSVVAFAQNPVAPNAGGAQFNSPAPSIAGIPLTSTSSGIQIEFTNESQTTADLVNFGVDSSGQHFVIRDVGTFSPCVSIKHKYRNGEGQAFVLPGLIAPRVNCSVVSVRFVDGTVWRKGRPVTHASNAKLSATPPELTIDRGAVSRWGQLEETPA